MRNARQPILFPLMRRLESREEGVGPFSPRMLTALSPQDVYKIAGLSRDSSGAVLGNCTVDLFDVQRNAWLDRMVSDAAGFYLFRGVGRPPANYYVRAYKPGAPDVFGTTANGLAASTEVVLTDTALTSWVVPVGVTKLVSIEAWGAGAFGGTGTPGGGGGGAWSRLSDFAVTPGSAIALQIGVSGASADSWFIDTATLLAKGATGVTGGAAASGVGTAKHSGGDGNAAGIGGGGGSGNQFGDGGASPGEDGGDSIGLGGKQFDTAPGEDNVEGGGGGHSAALSPGGPGGAPGGGGGASSDFSGATGARGQIRIVY